jgi:hypothetical protein
MTRSRPWPTVALLIVIWLPSIAAAGLEDLGAGAQRFATCDLIPNATRLDVLRRAGVEAIRCAIGPNMHLAILSDDTVSWPVIFDGKQAPASLEDPIAAKAWLPNTSAVRVRYDRDGFLLVRRSKAGLQAFVYSAFVSHTDADRNIDLFVALHIRPRPCLVGIVDSPGEALRLARDAKASCIAPVRVAQKASACVVISNGNIPFQRATRQTDPEYHTIETVSYKDVMFYLKVGRGVGRLEAVIKGKLVASTFYSYGRDPKETDSLRLSVLAPNGNQVEAQCYNVDLHLSSRQ